MHKFLRILWWLILLAAPFAAGYAFFKMRGMESLYFSMCMAGVYFVQGVYFLIRSLRFLFAKNYSKAGLNLAGLLIAAGLFFVMFWIWAFHWIGTSTNPPY